MIDTVRLVGPIHSKAFFAQKGMPGPVREYKGYKLELGKSPAEDQAFLKAWRVRTSQWNSWIGREKRGTRDNAWRIECSLRKYAEVGLQLWNEQMCRFYLNSFLDQGPTGYDQTTEVRRVDYALDLLGSRAAVLDDVLLGDSGQRVIRSNGGSVHVHRRNKAWTFLVSSGTISIGREDRVRTELVVYDKLGAERNAGNAISSDPWVRLEVRVRGGQGLTRHVTPALPEHVHRTQAPDVHGRTKRFTTLVRPPAVVGRQSVVDHVMFVGAVAVEYALGFAEKWNLGLEAFRLPYERWQEGEAAWAIS